MGKATGVRTEEKRDQGVYVLCDDKGPLVCDILSPSKFQTVLIGSIFVMDTR